MIDQVKVSIARNTLNQIETKNELTEKKKGMPL